MCCYLGDYRQFMIIAPGKHLAAQVTKELLLNETTIHIIRNI